ncbi:hypothetical protein NPIL_664551 [Nephila pilipes]|uniref:Uncharacterized protein n=1 Tax=Nephila pilipes TaxID=299642 RepID=A0A8X6UA93_NEPPI|nr:hypothetical protein NPIL_664551 [Nephila pilipes]
MRIGITDMSPSQGKGLEPLLLSTQKGNVKNKTNVKTIIVVFFYVRRNVHQKFVPPCEIINYLNVFRRLREDVPRKRLELWRSSLSRSSILTTALHRHTCL